MPKQSWFLANKRGDDAAEIAIFSDIGGFGVTAHDFNAALESFGDVSELRIRISSDGGDVFQGFAIYNMLNRHPAHKVVTVEGLAASMASVIAMAGDEIVMPSNAMLMIHNPWGGIVGESDQVISFGEALGKMREGILKAYQDRLSLASKGIKRSDLVAMLDRETWLDAKEAVAKGFADRIEKPVQMAARATFNVSKFSNAPAALGKIINRKDSTMSKKPTEGENDGEGEGDGVKSAADIRKEVLAQNEEVRSLCRLAGKPEMAEQFIKDDKSVTAVLAALDAAREEDAKKAKEKGGKSKSGSRGDDVSARHNPNNPDNQPVVDPSAIYDRWNSAGRKRATA